MAEAQPVCGRSTEEEVEGLATAEEAQHQCVEPERDEGHEPSHEHTTGAEWDSTPVGDATLPMLGYSVRCRLQVTPPSPTRPKPRRRRVAGSGTAVTRTVKSWKSLSAG